MKRAGVILAAAVLAAGCVFGDDKTGGGDVADVAADADVANVGVWYAREGGRPLIIAHRGGAGGSPNNLYAQWPSGKPKHKPHAARAAA